MLLYSLQIPYLFGYNGGFPFQNNPKSLDPPSYELFFFGGVGGGGGGGGGGGLGR